MSTDDGIVIHFNPLSQNVVASKHFNREPVSNITQTNSMHDRKHSDLIDSIEVGIQRRVGEKSAFLKKDLFSIIPEITTIRRQKLVSTLCILPATCASFVWRNIRRITTDLTI
jgi:hypothetical protein